MEKTQPVNTSADNEKSILCGLFENVVGKHFHIINVRLYSPKGKQNLRCCLLYTKMSDKILEKKPSLGEICLNFVYMCFRYLVVLFKFCYTQK